MELTAGELVVVIQNVDAERGSLGSTKPVRVMPELMKQFLFVRLQVSPPWQYEQPPAAVQSLLTVQPWNVVTEQ